MDGNGESGNGGRQCVGTRLIHPEGDQAQRGDKPDAGIRFAPKDHGSDQQKHQCKEDFKRAGIDGVEARGHSGGTECRKTCLCGLLIAARWDGTDGPKLSIPKRHTPSPDDERHKGHAHTCHPRDEEPASAYADLRAALLEVYCR